MGRKFTKKKKLSDQGYFNAKLIRDKWEDYISNKNKLLYDLWNVLMFQAWRDEK